MATKNVKAVVAPRKTVKCQGKYVGPGGEVILPADEVAELRSIGFLVDPGAAAAPPAGPGPSFEVSSGGPTVTETGTGPKPKGTSGGPPVTEAGTGSNLEGASGEPPVPEPA